MKMLSLPRGLATSTFFVIGFTASVTGTDIAPIKC